MKKIYKKLGYCGHSPGIRLDKVCMSISEFQVGDMIEVKCSKGKVTLIKVDKVEENK